MTILEEQLKRTQLELDKLYNRIMKESPQDNPFLKEEIFELLPDDIYSYCLSKFRCDKLKASIEAMNIVGKDKVPEVCNIKRKNHSWEIYIWLHGIGENTEISIPCA